MQRLTFLSKINREKIEALKKQISESSSPEEIKKLNDKVTGLEANRKPLNQCSMEECLEFKELLYEKFVLLQSIGKNQAARNFLLMMQTVESRMSTIQLEIMRKEEENKSSKNEEKQKTEKVERKSKNAKWTSISID